MKFSKALRTAAADTVLCVVHPEAWASIRTGAVGLAFVLLRLALLLTFPVSVPLMAWAIHRDSARRLAQAQDTRARVLAAHRPNGRV